MLLRPVGPSTDSADRELMHFKCFSGILWRSYLVFQLLLPCWRLPNVTSLKNAGTPPEEREISLFSVVYLVPAVDPH